jgi:hypothetical protein
MIEVLKQSAEDVSKVYDILAFGHTERALEILAKTRTSLRQAIAKLESQEPAAVYGYCPECGAKGVMRERRPDGNDKCANGHTYQSCKATHPPQRTEPPAWFPAVENILNEYGLQAIDFVADFKAAMKDAEQSQRTEERNFCSRCGKRLGKRLDGIDSIHTCTPPQEKNT